MEEIYSMPGSVATVWLQNGIPSLFYMENFQEGSGFKAIVTNISTRASVNAQFQNSISDYIYVYLFNKRMTEMNISGITYLNDCLLGNSYHGSDAIKDYFDVYNAVNTGTPLIVTMAGRGFAAYLIGMQQTISDPEALIGKFSMTLAAVP